jgi:hypothetical protein
MRQWQNPTSLLLHLKCVNTLKKNKEQKKLLTGHNFEQVQKQQFD